MVVGSGMVISFNPGYSHQQLGRSLPEALFHLE
jgi:hypothetical protein